LFGGKKFKNQNEIFCRPRTNLAPQNIAVPFVVFAKIKQKLKNFKPRNQNTKIIGPTNEDIKD
jgi:hypothetical protein